MAVFSPSGGLDRRPRNLHKGIDDMRNVKYFLATALIVGIAILSVTKADAKKDDKKDEVKYTIKKVMQIGMARISASSRKPRTGRSLPKRRRTRRGLRRAGRSETLQGDPEGWKTFTDKIVKAAKERW